ncbi:MAG: hypothetical protein HKN50_07635 [Gammaproteobacteria bacterium]|nr:hypothetical protein [Gammaproteobacteria bacterium]
MNKHKTSSTLFERTVRQSLFRRDRVVLFDQNWDLLSGQDCDSIIVRLAKLADLSAHLFDGATFTEQKLVETLISPKAARSFDSENVSHLNRMMLPQSKCLVVVHNAHRLSPLAIKSITRLVKHATRTDVACKFLLLADVPAMELDTMAQLGIAKAYPKSLGRIKREREHPVESRITDATKSIRKVSNGFIERLSERFFS